jgi:primosomal protein N' (replication factor Y)
MIGMCHICKTTYPYTHECSNCGGHNVSDYGLGTQKVAEYITKYTGKQTCIIESETANSPKKIHTLLSSINTPTPPIVIATNILITPLHNWKSDLLIYLDADRGMTNPDFMSYSDTFHNIYSGIRYHQSPHIIIQTFDPQKPPIYFAVRNDPDGYKTYEQQYRKNHSYPPYGELCVLIYKHEKEQNLLTKIQKIYQELLYLQEKYDQSLEIFSTPPLIYKTFGKLRYHIVIK